MADADERQDRDLIRIARERRLPYPIASKADFVAAMAATGESVRFRDQTYPVEFAANLIPEFFFPILDEEDLVAKAGDLLVARGLSPLPSAEGRKEAS